MAVLFVGTSHATAPLAMIERLAFTPDDAAALLASITPGDRIPALPLRELVVLSTCHRVELYAVPADGTRPSAALDALARVLASRGGDAEPIDASMRRLVGAEASRHLFRVAAGLESRSLRALAKEIGCSHTAIDNSIQRICERIGIRKQHISDASRARMRAARVRGALTRGITAPTPA